MKEKENKQVIMKYWWEKAQDCLLSAEREIEHGSLSFAINRLYYSLFYAVSSELLEKGYSYKKHTGVRAAFHKNFIRTGKMDKKMGKLYDQLFEDRQDGDYIAFIDFEKEYVKEKLANCKEFIDKLSKLSYLFD